MISFFKNKSAELRALLEVTPLIIQTHITVFNFCRVK